MQRKLKDLIRVDLQVFTVEMLNQYLDSFPKKLLKLQLILEILFLLEYVIVENCLTLLHVGARSRDSGIYIHKTMQPD